MTSAITIWLRNDLRWHDNPALTQGIAYAQSQNKDVTLVFAITPAQWLTHNDAKAKIALKAQLLENIAQQATSLGIRFDYLVCPDFTHQAEHLLNYCQQNNVSDVFFNNEYPINERRRDQTCEEKLAQHGVSCHRFYADLLLDLELYNQQGSAYRSFAPWLKAWLAKLQQSRHNIAPLPSALPKSPLGPVASSSLLYYKTKGDNTENYSAEEQSLIALFDPASPCEHSDAYRADLWPGNEEQALQKLNEYCQNKIIDYPQTRDLPSLNGTSTLSPYLAVGALSPRQCLSAITQYHAHLSFSDNQWLIELGWREFYRYLSWHWPHISYGHNYKSGVNTHKHSTPNAAELAWQQGQTGIPIIDAAMLQLKNTGWMHNRLRMLVANYYCHLIGGNWQHGEAFFMQHLIDGDFAANNGGWQWCASSGCDASPWPRIFNPFQQSKKFDPDGKFIKRFLPQLKHLDAKQLHKEQDFSRVISDYYPPLIDYKTARQNALAYLKEAKAS